MVELFGKDLLMSHARPRGGTCGGALPAMALNGDQWGVAQRVPTTPDQ